ncbi:low-specificity L-threonine aldolase [Acidaminobacter sp.]|uniref:low-specificity L-threonine aldolase n=1 Tax=Acidaminobacter sp. TaxID=1872102 RepID=UPI00255E3F70|nr:low-specificity L-threonine aldolase [Acidaminobacter sp.]MDK9710414.1 low-specificity L-threonine aldolase [Acidaminobacter sp.]
MTKRWIDLRSDTVTLQPEEMKRAMFEAQVGDDVYEDDPATAELERYAAELLGKDAALFVPSGTFANQLAIMTHTRRGDEIIIGQDAHIQAHEVGAAAALAGVQLKTVPVHLNQIEALDVRRAIRDLNDVHYPKTALICIENALGNGCVLTLDNMKEIYRLAYLHNIPVHLDGARLFNAALALGVPAKTVAAQADTVNICLSKGLAAPIGSLLLGSKDFIRRARKNRKRMGGGMRQTGYLAAAGLYALTHMVDRLKDDHQNAVYLASRLAEIPGIEIMKHRRDINMVFFKLEEGMIKESTFLQKLMDAGIKSNGMEDGEYRFVTHYGIEKEDIDTVIDVMKACLMQ